MCRILVIETIRSRDAERAKERLTNREAPRSKYRTRNVYKYKATHREASRSIIRAEFRLNNPVRTTAKVESGPAEV
ncbi:hypothetical protein NDU88_006895 [Pleurodeles waltl]|uniref:Uncharacterized protein n=1 Tax=Pleurodeles waltl TaxID=8319 RepID=A0AAV7NRQ2_PLEWA|nr:hypothetical protein NDU88_006895 [Pleurodeles waltl]